MISKAYANHHAAEIPRMSFQGKEIEEDPLTGVLDGG
jgi:hypothetical protein